MKGKFPKTIEGFICSSAQSYNVKENKEETYMIADEERVETSHYRDNSMMTVHTDHRLAGDYGYNFTNISQ